MNGIEEVQSNFVFTWFAFIDSKLFREWPGDSYKLYLYMRRYTNRRRDGALGGYYLKGWLVTAGTMPYWANLFGVDRSTISRWLKWLEDHKLVLCLSKTQRAGERSIYALGQVYDIPGGKPVEVFYLDHAIDEYDAASKPPEGGDPVLAQDAPDAPMLLEPRRYIPPEKETHVLVHETHVLVHETHASEHETHASMSLNNREVVIGEEGIGEGVNDVNRSISSIRIESADPNALEGTVAKKKLTLGEQLALENQRADRAAQVYARTVQGKDEQRAGDTDSSVPRQPGDLEAWLAHLAAAKRLEPGQLARLDVKPKVVQKDEKTVTDGFSVREIWAHPVWRDQFQESLKAKVKVVKDTGARINRQTVIGMACKFRPEQKGLAPDGSILSTTPASSRPIEVGKYASSYYEGDGTDIPV
jgi:hypothetical protein